MDIRCIYDNDTHVPRSEVRRRIVQLFFSSHINEKYEVRSFVTISKDQYPKRVKV